MQPSRSLCPCTPPFTAPLYTRIDLPSVGYRNGPYVHHSTCMYTKACWGIPVEEEYKKKEKEKVFEKERKERWVDFLWSGGRSLKSSTFRGSPGHTRSCRPFEETSTNCLSGPYLTVYSTLRKTIGYLPPLTDETVLFYYYFLEKKKIPILYKKRYLSDRIKVVYKRIGLLTRKKRRSSLSFDKLIAASLALKTNYETIYIYKQQQSTGLFVL